MRIPAMFYCTCGKFYLIHEGQKIKCTVCKREHEGQYISGDSTTSVKILKEDNDNE